MMQDILWEDRNISLFGRGYYEKTTFVAYNLVNSKLQTQWIFDTDVDGKQYMSLGNHNLKGNTIRPAQQATRAEAAKLLYRIYSK